MKENYNYSDLLSDIRKGEDSKRQFKKNITSKETLAHELVAFSNSLGGKIFVGIEDNGEISGITPDDIHRINQMISNVASEHIKPPINPLSEVFECNGKLVMVIDVPKGINKPYQDKDGTFWVKSGADKRKATSREELQRMFQNSGLIHSDVMLVDGLTINDIDVPYFMEFYRKRFGIEFDENIQTLEQTLNNMYLAKGKDLNLSGALLFGKDPSYKLPVYIVKAMAFNANTIVTDNYADSRNITGRLEGIFQQTVSFLLGNIRHLQENQSINSLGIPEIPRIVFEELVANALLHRDYFISAPIRVFVFNDRIEIISPGHLANNLTIDNIKSGNSNVRNPVLTSFAYHILPYRGVGTGILRAISVYPHIDFIDDRDGNTFKCIIKRVK